MLPAIYIIKNRLEQGTNSQITIMSASNIIELLGLCLNNSYFLLQDHLFEQSKGAALESHVRSFVAKIYKKAFGAQNHCNSIEPFKDMEEIC